MKNFCVVAYRCEKIMKYITTEIGSLQGPYYYPNEKITNKMNMTKFIKIAPTTRRNIMLRHFQAMNIILVQMKSLVKSTLYLKNFGALNFVYLSYCVFK